MVKNSHDDKKSGTNGDSETIFVIEIKINSSKWQTAPKIYHTKKEAEEEAEVLKLRYPFLTGCRVVTRKEKEKD